MKFLIYSFPALALLAVCSGADPQKDAPEHNSAASDSFQVMTERFADIQILRYQVPGFERLSLPQKQLAYYLYEAGLSGRDIFYDQNYKHNLRVRKTLETVLRTYTGNKQTEDYKKFVTYAKRVFFSNGIHHHYSNIKMLPEFSFEYFKELIARSDQNKLPLEGKSLEDFTRFLRPLLFDPNVDAKLVDLSDSADNVKASSVNFYEGATEKEVEEFYAKRSKPAVKDQPSWGLNSKVVKEDGEVREKTWRVGGLYSPAIERIVYWLEKANVVAENEAQRRTFRSLIEYYRTGDLAKFDQYSILWVKDTESLIDAVNGFIEVYHDPLQKKGSYESVVSMKDLEATKRIAAISKEAQWFEDRSPIIARHKKKNVTGISAKVIIVVGEAGDASPTTPIGINLPNAEWIREQHGSKSVSLGNIVAAYNYVKARSPSIQEFGVDREVVDRVKKYGALASDLHTDMHEVIGHASGQIDPGVGTTDQTLKNYAGTLEEARADLVALYYTLDPKLIEMGVMPSLEVGKAEYDSYILNGLLTQLFKIKPGENLEEAHMRNRQLVAGWAYQQGHADNVIERVIREGKTFYKINDYEKLRHQFSQLLREIQRIKSEGDFEAGKQLVETYGVKVDQELLQEVHKRYEPLNIAPYMGFIQPRLVPVMNGDRMTDVRVEYPTDFLEQMLEYGRDYSLLPLQN
jgi:dipeptidyl-peptidase III